MEGDVIGSINYLFLKKKVVSSFVVCDGTGRPSWDDSVSLSAALEVIFPGRLISGHHLRLHAIHLH